MRSVCKGFFWLSLLLGIMQPYDASAQITPANCESTHGIKAGSVCCPEACGRCGGAGCQGLPGGASECCGNNIVKTSPLCSGADSPPCVFADFPDLTATLKTKNEGYDLEFAEYAGRHSKQDLDIQQHGEIHVKEADAIYSILFARDPGDRSFCFEGAMVGLPEGTECPSTPGTHDGRFHTRVLGTCTQSQLVALVYNNIKEMPGDLACYYVQFSVDGTKYWSDPKIYNMQTTP